MAVAERTRVQLPPGVGDRYEVYVNGVRQEPGRDFDRVGDVLLFNRTLASEGRLGAIRWLSMLLGIAVAVAMFDPVVGIAFVVLAILIAVGRVIVGAHYPGDVLAAALVGSASAFVVVRYARPVIAFVVRGVERITDPVLAPLWRRRERV